MPSLQDRLQRRLRASKVTEDESDYSDDYSDLDRGQRNQSEATHDGGLASDKQSDCSGDNDSDDGTTRHRRRKDQRDSDGDHPEVADDDDSEEHNTSEEEEDEEGDGSDELSEANAAEALANISFGALAQAQAAMGPSLKRKRGANLSSVADPGAKAAAAAEDPASRPHRKISRSPSPFHEASERRKGKKLRDIASRASKHAPTEITSKRAVSRRRTVVNIPSKPQARDPRFAALPGSSTTTTSSYPSLYSRQQQNNNNIHHANPSLSSSTAAPNSAYAFLADYRASELAELKAQAKQERDPAKRETLTKQLRAIEDRDRARRKVEEERAVLREHRKKERDMVGKGKQPFFLKKGEVKRQAMVKRYEGLGEKKMEKMLEKRRKRKAAKERKGMPAARRGFTEG